MEFIDLGLPSGTKWASRNVGAASQGGLGVLCTFSEAVTTSNDYGGSLPSVEDFLELEDNCKWFFVDWEGIRGQLVLGKNGNSIFLPASLGDGEIWLTTPFEDNPNLEVLTIFVDANGKDGASWIPKNRQERCSIRMVIK